MALEEGTCPVQCPCLQEQGTPGPQPSSLLQSHVHSLRQTRGGSAPRGRTQGLRVDFRDPVSQSLALLCGAPARSLRLSKAAPTRPLEIQTRSPGGSGCVTKSPAAVLGTCLPVGAEGRTPGESRAASYQPQPRKPGRAGDSLILGEHCPREAVAGGAVHQPQGLPVLVLRVDVHCQHRPEDLLERGPVRPSWAPVLPPAPQSPACGHTSAPQEGPGAASPGPSEVPHVHHTPIRPPCHTHAGEQLCRPLEMGVSRKSGCWTCLGTPLPLSPLCH